MYRAWALFVFTLDGEAIAEITAFLDPSLPTVFGLPAAVDAH
jgi:hypothetical protein